MENRQLVALIGAAILFVGVFTPIVSFPIVGNMNYFQNGRGDGVIVLLLAVISVFLALSRRYGGLWLTGGDSMAVLIFTFANFQLRLGSAKEEVAKQLAGNPFRGLAEVAMQTVQLQWGWAILIVGTVMLFIAAAMNGGSTRPVERPNSGLVPPSDSGSTAQAEQPAPDQTPDTQGLAVSGTTDSGGTKASSELPSGRRCPKCGFPRSDGKDFIQAECSNCGIVFAKLKIVCPQCGKETPGHEVVKIGMCPRCGVDVAVYSQMRAQAAKRT